jgi:DNA-binding response OmpR family regulator
LKRPTGPQAPERKRDLGGPTRLLLVEDDAPTRRMLANFLQRNGFDVTATSEAETAMTMIADHDFDVALIDIMLPGITGWTLIGHLRLVSPDLPILFLTAMTTLDDELRGFGLGADDYLRKPIDPNLLKARLNAILIRSGRAGKRAYQGLLIDFTARAVTVDGNSTDLSQREFNLLAVLASQPKRVFTRNDLIDRVWGSDYDGSERGVDTRINSLRRKLGDTGRRPRFIAAVRGIGYRFIAGDANSEPHQGTPTPLRAEQERSREER